MRITPLTLLGCAAFLSVDCNRKAPAPPVAPALAPAAPTTPPPGPPMTGKVLERIDTSPYSYLRLATAKGEVWTAVPLTKTEKGKEVTIERPVPMQNFESRTLKRTFALVYFGTLQEQANSGIQHELAAQGPSDLAVPKLARAPGAEGRTVAEIHANRLSLKGKTVAIQGQVVKVNFDIMGRNWLHLRDGSGQGATADLTLTTSDKVAVGDIVIARGTLSLDKDFGAGYRYSSIVEDAKITPRKQ